ncbi:hypothetical protein GCM10009547_17560 [Sporichthya brevicatena]|uniref:Uncharacterized protein n=1 Tax=Sporichthya brevicatena TaxID=171442 RepID=A0ABN1GPV6_9ACTN
MNNDYDLIERLRTAGTATPPSRHTPDVVLAAGRKAHSRRSALRVSGAALSLAAVVVAGMQLTPSNSGPQLVTAAGDGASAPAAKPAPAVKPAPVSTSEFAPDADATNAAILQKAMGKDFAIAEDQAHGRVLPGTKSAAGLPGGYAGVVSLNTSVSNEAGLAAMCKPMVEKGATIDGCITRSLPDGREIQVSFSRWAPTAAHPQDTAGESVRVYFLQPNGLLTWADLTASTLADENTAASRAAVKTWLDSMVDRLGAAAANPGVEAQGFDGDHCTVTGDVWDCSTT